MNIRNLRLDGANPESMDFYLDGKRVTQMWLDGVCVWDVGEEITNLIIHLADINSTATINFSNIYGTFKTATIDWGDGNTSTWNYGDNTTFTHNYNIDSATITIYADTISTINQGFFSIVDANVGIDIPISIMYIGQDFCYLMKNLKSVSLGKGLITIPQRAFHSTGLESIIIPSNVKALLSSCFYNCSSLKKVAINEGVEAIYDSVFRFCNLTSITLPSTLKVLGVSSGSIFDEYLTDIYYNSTVSNWNGIQKCEPFQRGDWWYRTVDIKYTVHCTDGNIDYTLSY